MGIRIRLQLVTKTMGKSQLSPSVWYLHAYKGLNQSITTQQSFYGRYISQPVLAGTHS